MKKIKIKQALVLICISLFALSCSKSDDEVEVIAGVPTAYSAVNLTDSGFTANWTRVYRADKYLVDVSTTADFSTLIPSYNELAVNALTLDISGLNAGATYYYRVRAVRGALISVYSNVIATEIISTGPEPTTALKEAANFKVGMIVRSTALTGQTSDIILREFDNITSEYEMKMDKMYPSKGTYDFTAVDKIVKYATDNKLNLHGHALIWHNATPDWVKNFTGTDAEFEIMVKEYITTVVTRYKGKVKSWDVVNEAVDDGSGNPLRNSVFKQKMGDDYIKKCYQWARAADPDCKLFYNDYNFASSTTKRAAIFKIADALKVDNLIDGLGAQMHISYKGPAASEIQAVVDGTVSRKLLMHFSELDIQANPDNDLKVLTPERAILQKNKYKEVVKIFNSIPTANQYALTVWGMRDSESWLLDFWGHIDWPLMYNNDYSVKKAHTGFLEGLK
ncbi:endo-1,4-beta-xylanase [Flavobacterium algicola]|uniref:endo-1,4-beta-xylanase n=1 Tax=Flavobacterium algicola TaxID=556529 RepID=UPI001EFD6698|nr:endo-1,4-beta-xylanase [Flavobacterium algicola]MCG9793412.1 endo-1,4-beta-xylanase [Flavobacterium algicola]